jgi:hypothetical protein
MKICINENLTSLTEAARLTVALVTIILTIYCQDQYNHNNIDPTSQYNNIHPNPAILLLCPGLLANCLLDRE